ncbi:MAG: type II CRISPR RNA-guided endonuclease Cas9, partial [Thermoguttaceae bacterium]
FMLMGQNAENSALHAAGYLRPDERAISQRRFLPIPPQLTNPLVRQAMYEVRKTINAILKELVYRQGHELTHIYVELVREAKKSFNERMEIRIDNSKKRKIRDDAAKAIEEHDSSIKPTRATINRYLLWKEQSEDCPYCGKKISLAQLFNGDADVDHILPRWRSLDDSMANKVVAHKKCNQDKGDKTPYEWLAESDPKRYETVLKIASKLSFGKQRKFQQKEVVLDDFVKRQLTDTAYITRCVSQYLYCLGVEIVCTRGQMTADLRHYWGLNTILNPEGEGEKNRDDHRHHAVDALVIGLTDRKRLFALANDRGKNIQPPWPGFREESEKIIKEINVSHRPLRKLRGALHEATFYGATQKLHATKQCGDKDKRPWAKGWTEGQNQFARRKPVASLTKTQDLEKIRDPAIRELLRLHLCNQNIDPDKYGKLPGDAFKGKNTPKMPSGIPIKRVRMVETSDMMQPVSRRRNYQFVEPGSNHHIVIYKLFDEQEKPIVNSDGTPKQDGEIITMFEVGKRILNKQCLIDRSDKKEGNILKKFAMSLSINEMFLLEMPDGPPMLHRIQKLSEGSIILRPHTYAGKVSDKDKPPLIQRKTPNTLRGQKVTVDRLGRIRRAND